MNTRQRIAVWALSLSAAGFSSWQVHEGFTREPIIPTKGDVPTIGFGSTYYEDGTRVTMDDPPITRERAVILARNLGSEHERCLKRSLPEDAELFQVEFDLYVDFIGQYGCGRWMTSTPRRELAAGNYLKACDGLLLYKKQAGRDCSLPQNWGPQGCKGVWTRQLERHQKCLGAQIP